MTPEIALRPATVDDAPALASLAEEAFVSAFAHLYRAEDLAAFLTAERSVDAYRAKLANPDVRAQLAFVDGNLAAYCLVAWNVPFEERPAPQPAKPMFLSQLYCAGGMTGLGLGRQLMEWAFGEARAGGADAIQLSVYSENFGAQRFYQRYGFEKVADIGFWVGAQRDAEFLYEVGL